MSETLIGRDAVDTLVILLRTRRGMEDLREQISIPHASTGIWFVDLHVGEKYCVVMYQDNRGYGLCFTLQKADFSNAPDETVTTIQEAVDKVYDFFLR